MLIQKQYRKKKITRNLNREGNTKMLFIIEKSKETILVFSQRSARVLQIYFALR